MDALAAAQVLPENVLTKLLTIAIPTYNRVAYLAPLLDEVGAQWTGLEAEIDVFVSNNCSTDETQGILDAFVARHPGATVVTNASNLGADGNIAACFARSDSKYVWVLGDDDLPRRGALARIVEILKQANPDLVYMNSTPIGVDAQVSQMECGRVDSARYRLLSQERFATLVNVNLTFISAVLVNKSLIAPTVEASATIGRPLMGTSLVQLTWVLGALRAGSRFVHVEDTLLLSTTANSGGYSVLKVFCVNHTKAVRMCLASAPHLADLIISRAFTGYLPGLIWNVRRSTIGSFVLPAPREIVEPVMTAQWQYWCFLLPIWTMPVWCSWLVLQFSKVVRKLVWTYDTASSPRTVTLTSESGRTPP